jgi:hypothetical protein
MGFSLSQSLFDLAPNGHRLAALPFEKAQAIPQPDDLAFSVGVHALLEQKENDMTSRYE